MFRVGDKVKCIEGYSYGHPKEGEIYTVIGIRGPFFDFTSEQVGHQRDLR